jgi:hypothetical protein
MLLLAGVALAFFPLLETLETETSLRYRIGGDHALYEELELRYFHEGEEVSGARFSFPGGVPATVDHSVSLPRGEVWVEVSLRGRETDANRRHRFQTPTEGTLVLTP